MKWIRIRKSEYRPLHVLFLSRLVAFLSQAVVHHPKERAGWALGETEDGYHLVGQVRNARVTQPGGEYLLPHMGLPAVVGDDEACQMGSTPTLSAE